MASCREEILKFFPRKTMFREQAKRLRGWKLGQPLPMPPPKKVRRTDVRSRPPPEALFREVCGEVCSTHGALRVHYNKTHAVLDDQPVGVDSLCNDAGELWAFAEAFLWFIHTLIALAKMSQNWRWKGAGL